MLPPEQPGNVTQPAGRSRFWSSVIAAAAVAAFILSHTVASWLHLLLLPVAIYLVIAALLAWRKDRGQSATEVTRRRYDRLAPFYDVLQATMELGARKWRRELWQQVGRGRMLEIGVGTGRSIPHYPSGQDIVAIDLSPRMLAKAKRRAKKLGSDVRLELADVQALPYADATFDVVVATFLFCSVPDPVAGLREARRVLKPGGRLLLLEHVLSRKRLLGRLMHWLDPVASRLWGAHIDRDTVGNVRLAGFTAVHDVDRSLDIVKQITARP